MTDKTNQPPALIVVRPAKRGYLIEVAGSGEAPYPCLTPEDIGNAIIEILEDPDRESVEFVSPTDEPSSAATAVAPRAAEPEAEDEYEDAEDEEDDGLRPPGWDAGDELAMKLFGKVTERARKISRWRQGE